jgi:hypothetical protein
MDKNKNRNPSKIGFSTTYTEFMQEFFFEGQSFAFSFIKKSY